MTINAFKSGIFPLKMTQGNRHPSNLARVAKTFDRTRLKILAPKQILHRLPVVFAQIQAVITSEN